MGKSETKPTAVLFLDLEESPCSTGNCRSMEELVRGRAETEGARYQSESSRNPAVIVVRFSPSDASTRALEGLRHRFPTSALVGILCGHWEDPRSTLSLVERHLDDFISCPARGPDLLLRVERQIGRKADAAPRAARPTLQHELQLDGLVGASPKFLDAVLRIPRIAKSLATVVIYGETGTGKELFARAIHYKSQRQNKPFVPVNCGALPDHLFENELFGHAKGAYTDASAPQAGLLAVADGGTLLLDEVDTLSLAAQAKLLRFLQEKQYRPLGSSQTYSADVRVLAATNADLRARVEARLFREDLYHRLNVLSLAAPPLRERSEDIVLLAQHFADRFAELYRYKPATLSAAVIEKLVSYSWPGNVRELECMIHRAVVFSESGNIDERAIEIAPPRAETSGEISMKEAKDRAIAEFERGFLTNLLVRCGGNISHAAKSAGKERRAFQRLIRKHHLQPSLMRG